ncbi:hypothetical protein GF362_02895 [Candidatus Dojkabacteria bacterium]|nr:hypothetical protein [Candidatus Dojkabacteria bacterium]
MSKAFAVTPGKTILFGEHTVVYPKYDAILTTINLNSSAEAQITGKNGNINFLEYKNPLYKMKDMSYSQQEIFKTYEQAQKARNNYLSGGDFQSLSKVVNEDYGFFKIIFAIALTEIDKHLGYYPSFNINFNSNLPFSAGFGFSASLGASLISSMLKAAEIDFNNKKIFDLTLEYEKFQHGNPSGADPAIIVYGQMIQFSKKSTSKPSIKQLEIKNPDLKSMLSNSIIIHTGSADQSTGELVNFVQKEKSFNRRRTNKIFDAIQTNLEQFINESESNKFSTKKYIDFINSNGILLEKLGVVSDRVKEISAIIRSRGGACKISGAGGQGKDKSGALLTYHSNKSLLQELAANYHYKFYDVGFGTKGLITDIIN